MAGVGMVGTGKVQARGFDSQYSGPRSATCCSEAANEPASPVEIISKPQPAYTEEGRELGIEGEVRLQIRFTAAGKVQVLKVLQGVGARIGRAGMAQCRADQVPTRDAQRACC